MIHSIHHPKKERYTKFVPHFSGESPLSEHAIIGNKIYHTTTAQGDYWPKLFRLFLSFLSTHVKSNPVKITRYSRCCLEVEKKNTSSLTNVHFVVAVCFCYSLETLELHVQYGYKHVLHVNMFSSKFQETSSLPVFFLLHIVFWFYLCQTVDDLFSQICI